MTATEALASPCDRAGDARPQAEAVFALVADLRDWALHLEDRSYTQRAVTMLSRNLHHVVATAVGYTLSLRTGLGLTSDVAITVLDDDLGPDGPCSALTVRLPLGQDGIARAVFYATAPTAFDTLAAQLSEQLGLPLDHLVVETTVDRPTRAGITGLTDFTRVNYALGVLLGRGYGLAEARERLRAGAVRFGSVPAAAEALLASIDADGS